MAHQHNENIRLPNDAYDVIRERLIKDLTESGLSDAGVSLYTYIVNSKPSTDTDLSFGALKLIIARDIQTDIPDRDCLTVINYFTGGRSRILDVILTFIDPESGDPHTLDNKESAQLLLKNEFFHPLVNDELVENCKEHIIISYKPSNISKQVYYLLHPSNSASNT